ncbi:MAG: hypothetical protein ACOYYS_13890 [Chloroflexota bacterium]
MKSNFFTSVHAFLRARRFPLACALIVAVLTSLPYIFGAWITPDDRVFMGIVTNTPDIAQYWSWWKGFTTANLISNQLTPEPNEAVFFNLLWWLLAKISVLTGASAIGVTQGYRIFSIFAFALALDWFIRMVQPEAKRRAAAFLLAYFGGGLGWLWVVEKYLSHRSDVLFPADVYVIESNSFLAMLGFNHFIISATLMLLIYGFFLLGYERQQWRYTALACLSAIVLGWEHAYDILLMGAILAAFTLALLLRDGWRWQPVISLFLVGITSIWPSLYSLYITRTFPVWKAVLAQFDNAGAWTPDPFHLLFLMGLPFIAALLGFTGFVPLKRLSPQALFVRVWFLANFFLIYIPLNFQIHYLNGWQIPVAILAAETFFGSMLPWLEEKLQALAWVKRISWTRLSTGIGLAVLAATLLVNVYLLAWQFVVVKRLPHTHFPYKDEVAALDWLAQNAQADDVVLSASDVGQYIPSRTGARAFIAHWAMTKDLYEKQALVEAFFDAATPAADRLKVIEEYSVDYVLVGASERELGGFDASEAAFLQPCFSLPKASVYCVLR